MIYENFAFLRGIFCTFANTYLVLYKHIEYERKMENFNVTLDYYVFVRLLDWILPFMIGLATPFIIDFFRNKLLRRQKKELVIDFLKKIILEAIPVIIIDANSLKQMLISNSRERISIHACESFNTMVLDSVHQTDYYLIFKKEKYNIFVDIYSMIKFFESNMPIMAHRDYINKVELHLKDINKIGDIDHVNECITCKNSKEDTLRILDFRIKELNALKTKIEELIL